MKKKRYGKIQVDCEWSPNCNPPKETYPLNNGEKFIWISREASYIIAKRGYVYLDIFS